LVAQVKLRELIAGLASLDDGMAIHTADATPSAFSEVVLVDDGGRVPPGHHYLLEVAIAKEVVEVWSRWRGGRAPTTDAAVEAVLHYAAYDAFVPVEIPE
jgi:hypothetical protein